MAGIANLASLIPKPYRSVANEQELRQTDLGAVKIQPVRGSSVVAHYRGKGEGGLHVFENYGDSRITHRSPNLTFRDDGIIELTDSEEKPQVGGPK